MKWSPGGDHFFQKAVTNLVEMVLIRVRREMRAVEDNKIVELYLSRDERAIEQSKEKYGRRLRSLAYGIVNDKQTAEECESDTYLEAWNSIPPHEPRTYLYAFLARITRRVSLNCCRTREALKRKAFIGELSAEMEQCIPAPDDTECRMNEIQLKETINGFLSTLDNEKRNVFIRRYWYMDSIREISKRFAISESKVKISLFRTRNQLREYLEQEGYIL